MTAILIGKNSESEASIFFRLIERIIETSIDKATGSGIATGDDISSSARSHGSEASEDWL
jgi:hypothetical protein